MGSFHILANTHRDHEPGKDAFHRVPDFARNKWDAVERVLTIPEDRFKGRWGRDRFLMQLI